MHDDLLRLWFGPTDPDGPFGFRMLWFTTDPEFDAQLRGQFGELYAQACDGALDHWVAEPRTALALVILLDQLSRNLNRNSPETWAHDPHAKRIADEAIAAGHDQALPLMQRTFLYMPFMHSEDRADQARALALFEAIAAEDPEGFAGSLRSAHHHKDVVDRFGRFPHRNAILGRENTPEEQAFLDAPGNKY